MEPSLRVSNAGPSARTCPLKVILASCEEVPAQSRYKPLAELCKPAEHQGLGISALATSRDAEAQQERNVVEETKRLRETFIAEYVMLSRGHLMC